ncbi:SDR family oxidoreductase [Capsulimonas corticalis]|uniref:SDR family oxidoreductase n=1 Tax=Capsulimonas corticalis TaxID=2219043 RepID=UPI00260A2037|nr:SDR family oxidoreductase [Capsulimonas corticalis]
MTASSQGLGRACAEVLAREGAKVVINGRRPEYVARAAQEIRQVMAVRGADVHTLAGDITHPEDIARLLKATIARFGQLDILVINGGGPPPGKFTDLTEEDWRQALDSTFWPSVRLIRQALPHLQQAKERGGGRIVQIMSTSVKQPIDGLLLSNTLRPAAIGLAKSLSKEFATDGILINNVCPGSFDTQRLRDIHATHAEGTPLTPEQVAQQAAERIPLGRFGDPKELANLVAFLVSDKATYITGQTICVDGGVTNTLLG